MTSILFSVNIFVSWSGDYSQHVAGVLRQHIRKVVQEADCFFSKGDIEAGTPWLLEISDKLVSHSIGLICVTKENQERPWINFEAGALASGLDSAHVVPLLIEMAEADLKMPLASFHAKLCDKAGLFDVFQMINRQAERPLPIEELREQFEIWWPRISDELTYATPAKSSAQPTRNQHEILEEILLGVRQLLREREGTAKQTVGVTSAESDEPPPEYWDQLDAQIHAWGKALKMLEHSNPELFSQVTHATPRFRTDDRVTLCFNSNKIVSGRPVAQDAARFCMERQNRFNIAMTLKKCGLHFAGIEFWQVPR
jgi:TIR domain